MENDTNYLIEQAAKPPEQPGQVELIERNPFMIKVRWFKPIDNSALIFQYEVSIGPHGRYVGYGNPQGIVFFGHSYSFRLWIGLWEIVKYYIYNRPENVELYIYQLRSLNKL